MPVFGFKDAGIEISTESLGTLRFHRVTPEYAARIEKADFQHDLPPNAFLSLLLVTLGSRDDGRPILIEEAYGLSDGEREAFVHAFLNEHGEYYRERVVEERMSARGEKVTRSFLGDRVVNPRQPSEDPAAYLTRIYREFTLGVTPPPQHSEPIPAPLPPAPQLAEAAAGGDRFADSLLKNAALSESLGKTLAQMRMLEGKDEAPSAELASVVPAEPSAEEAAAPADAAAPSNVSSETAQTPAPEPAAAVEPSTQMIVAPSTSVSESSLPEADMLRINVPAEMTSTPVDSIRELNESVRRSLEDLAKIAHRNTRLIRSTRRIAIFALLLSLLLPLIPVGYLVWRDGFGEQTINKLLLKRSDQLTEQQKQQSDALKTLSDEVRSLRTQAPRQLAD